MKKNYILFYCIVFTTILSAQNTLQGKVFYTVSLKPFTEKYLDSMFIKLKTIKSVQPSVRKMFKNSKDVTGILEFSKNESLYQVENKMKNNGSKGKNMTLSIAGGNNIYYANFIKKEYFKQLNREELLVGLPQIKWTITQETKKVGDYTCFKAVSYRKTRKDRPSVKTTAWFTPVIPVSFGPINYFGLPGLILEVSYKNTSIKATKIILNPSSKIIIKKPRKGKRMTHEEYQEMNRNFFKNLRK
ncbi:GLPGLI family protein [Tenacibaculum haliotis]|uniref:GLPGLI family protein n=1 Tax=Tenacibaculum haliotis TaxID=1888914 RepID=UPI0021AFFD0D|nr:GLPGLI family protein [Tenacibaculum haliotis]MCT4700045.1 GLPGLI family protein [Tenacibaculum haliotis]